MVLETNIISSTSTYSIRKKVLWPHITNENYSISIDEHKDTFHLGTFINEKIISIGTFIKENNKEIRKIEVSDGLRKPIRVAISRSHLSEETIEMLKGYKDCKTISQGSSLKFCLVASGNAEIYPRLGPTSEWDTAAGHALVEFAGGVVEDLDGKSLRYNTKKSLLNPDFLVCCKHNLSKEIIPKLKNRS